MDLEAACLEVEALYPLGAEDFSMTLDCFMGVEVIILDCFRGVDGFEDFLSLAALTEALPVPN